MGGDHKCPLCAATFTRPQHVGRHLRAHTGDRPYECKECPLRFARSDLLSRHVNKAHRPPGENDKKDGRKGRRKSMGGQNGSGGNASDSGGGPNGSGVQHVHLGGGGGMKPRAASFSQFGQELVFPQFDASGNAIDPSALISAGLGGAQGMGAGLGGTGIQGQMQQISPQTALPAHQLYPHHPLLANSPRAAISGLGGMGVGAAGWQLGGAQPGVNGYTGTSDYNAYGTAMMGNANPYNGMPLTATPMRMSGSEQGMTSGAMGRAGSGNYLGMSIDYGTKKRACDQCNHSKVRCDFNDPCARCTTRNLGCSYNKPPKSRSIVQPMPWASRQSTANLGASNNGGSPGMSLSPTTQYSSPSSASGVSPIASTTNLDGSISSVARSYPTVPGQHGRSQSFGAASQFYAPTRPGMPVEAYSRTFPALQGWQGGMQQEAAAGASSNVGANFNMPVGTGSGTSFEYVPLGYDQQAQQAQQAQHSSPPQQIRQGQYYPYGPTGPSMPTASVSASPRNNTGKMQPPSIIPSGSGPTRQFSGSTSMRSEGSNGSPAGNNLAPTPALSASHTTSPSSSDEPAERRMSSFGSTGSAVRPEPAVQDSDTSPPPARDSAPKSALALSPSSMQPYASLDGSMTGMNTDWTSHPTLPSMLPPQMQNQQNQQQQQHHQQQLQQLQQSALTAAFGPRVINESSISLSTAGDDEDNGNALSRSDSLLEDMTIPAQAQNGNEAHRRRSSGIWTTAFSGMSLQDSQIAAAGGIQQLAPLAGLLNDPFSASQIASQAQAQAQAQLVALQAQVNAQAALAAAGGGTGAGAGGSGAGNLPAITEGAAAAAFGDTNTGTNGQAPSQTQDLGQGQTQGEMPMPSMADVKDLWKLFMNDPMTGFTPAGEKGNALEQTGMGAALATPRPAMGERTLSKSNSMPDLTSPFLGQAFFANYFNNAVTPRPGDGPVHGLDMALMMGQSQKRADGGIPAAAQAAMAQQAADGNGQAGGGASIEVLGPDEVIEPDSERTTGDGTRTAGPQIGGEEQQKAMNKWKTALSSRPANFAFQLNNSKVGGRSPNNSGAGSSVSPPADPTLSSTTTALNLHIPESRMNRLKASAGPGNMGTSMSNSMNVYPGMASTGMGGGIQFDLSGRPSASVIQPRHQPQTMGPGHARMNMFKEGFGAMNQTLAPERAPSFMMTPGIGAGPGSAGFGLGMGGGGNGQGNGSVQISPPKGSRNPIQAAAQMHAHAQAQALGQAQGQVQGVSANANANGSAFPLPPMFSFNTSNATVNAHSRHTGNPSGSMMGTSFEAGAASSGLSQVQISAAANALATAAAQATAITAAAAATNARPPQQHKGSSATTRPGNKRLASQVLGGEGKKATFGFWDDDETDVEYVQ